MEETSKVTGGKLDVLIANAAVGGDHFDLTLSELYVNELLCDAEEN